MSATRTSPGTRSAPNDPSRIQFLKSAAERPGSVSLPPSHTLPAPHWPPRHFNALEERGKERRP
jgi:hypothetical protein